MAKNKRRKKRINNAHPKPKEYYQYEFLCGPRTYEMFVKFFAENGITAP